MEFVEDLAYVDEETKKKASQIAVMLVSEIADRWGISSEEACHRLVDVDALDGYFFKYYDVLHTQGVNYLADDLMGLVEEREEEMNNG